MAVKSALGLFGQLEPRLGACGNAKHILPRFFDEIVVAARVVQTRFHVLGGVYHRIFQLVRLAPRLDCHLLQKLLERHQRL